MNFKLTILIYILSFSGFLSAQDSVNRKISISGFLSAEYTTLGYYGGLGIGIDYNNWNISFSPVMDYSKAVSMFDGPFGFVTNVSFFPNLNRDKTINYYINSVYRIRFSDRYCSNDNCGKKYNKTHEIALGYGIQVKMYNNLYLSSSINAGIFIEKLYSDYENKWINNKGFDTVIQLRLIYKFLE